MTPPPFGDFPKKHPFLGRRSSLILNENSSITHALDKVRGREIAQPHIIGNRTVNMYIFLSRKGVDGMEISEGGYTQSSFGAKRSYFH